jgi:hypothetical protein
VAGLDGLRTEVKVKHIFLVVTAAAITAAAACDSGVNAAGAASAAATDPRRNPGYIVDSVLPMEEELRRFRAGMDHQPTSLVHGLHSAEAAVQSLLSAAAKSDTAVLRQLHISREEFAFLYFPSSKFSKPPYELAPGLVWFQLTLESGKGITKLIAQVTNSEPDLDRIECSGLARIEGENRILSNCVTFWRSNTGAMRSGRIFGDMIERAGRIKFLSYANDL